MNVPPEVVEVLRQWVRKAEHDPEAVRRLLAVEQGCPIDVACFHCEQAAEKYLKALLTMEGIPAPRTHDLEQLLSLLPESRRPSIAPSALAGLNPYAVAVRYVDDWRELQFAEALAALDVAQAVRDEARRLLPPQALV